MLSGMKVPVYKFHSPGVERHGPRGDATVDHGVASTASAKARFGPWVMAGARIHRVEGLQLMATTATTSVTSSPLWGWIVSARVTGARPEPVFTSPRAPRKFVGNIYSSAGWKRQLLDFIAGHGYCVPADY